MTAREKIEQFHLERNRSILLVETVPKGPGSIKSGGGTYDQSQKIAFLSHLGLATIKQAMVSLSSCLFTKAKLASVSIKSLSARFIWFCPFT